MTWWEWHRLWSGSLTPDQSSSIPVPLAFIRLTSVPPRRPIGQVRSRKIHRWTRASDESPRSHFSSDSVECITDIYHSSQCCSFISWLWYVSLNTQMYIPSPKYILSMFDHMLRAHILCWVWTKRWHIMQRHFDLFFDTKRLFLSLLTHMRAVELGATILLSFYIIFLETSPDGSLWSHGKVFSGGNIEIWQAGVE